MQGSTHEPKSGSTANREIGALSNSSSPAPGAGRTMRGAVQGFDSRTGMGKIRGDDGATYRFFGAGVVGGAALRPGQVVEFNDNDGVATKIVSMGSGGSNLIGSVANSASPAPGAGRTMRGTVKGFDARTGMGKIRGDDDTTYSFFGAGVIGDKTLELGQSVEFNDKDGIATKIICVGGSARAAGTIGAISNSSSSQPSAPRPMHGTVRAFDLRTGMGKIEGSDGNIYRFFTAGIIGAGPLKGGNRVAFIDRDGVAVDIKKIRGRFLSALLGKFA